jgi:hypothetical protein
MGGLLQNANHPEIAAVQPTECDAGIAAPAPPAEVSSSRQTVGPLVRGKRVPSRQEEYYMTLFSFETIEELEEWMNKPSDPDLSGRIKPPES